MVHMEYRLWKECHTIFDSKIQTLTNILQLKVIVLLKLSFHQLKRLNKL